MASADFCRLSLASQPGLPLRLGDRPPQVRTLTFPAHLPHLLLRLLVASDFVVIGQLVQPHSLMGFVFLRSQVCLRLPSDPASRQRPCLQLAVGATNLRKGLSPSSQRPCWAHQKKSLPIWQALSPFLYSSSVPRAWMAPGKNIWKKMSSISCDV
jgi:hypothetical protein